MGGVTNYGYGITWGRKNWDNYHAMLINQNSAFTAFTLEYGLVSRIQDWVYSDKIKSHYNTLEIRKEGSQLVFVANGNALAKKPYKAFMGNEIGFQIENKRDISIEYIEIVQW